MASTIVEFRAPTGMTLDLDLYPYGSDTIANGASGDAATEQTNRKGVYQATVTEALTGWHTAHIMSGATVIAVWEIKLADDTNTYRCHDAVDEDFRTTLTNYSAERGLAGTALPAAAADAAGGLPISDAGGLDLDTILDQVYDVVVTGITTAVESAAGKHSLAGVVMISTNSTLVATTLTAKKPSDDTTFQTYTVTTASVDNITGVS